MSSDFNKFNDKWGNIWFTAGENDEEKRKISMINVVL